MHQKAESLGYAKDINTDKPTKEANSKLDGMKSEGSS
jgi:hypothetical protein